VLDRSPEGPRLVHLFVNMADFAAAAITLDAGGE
jgi:hypothetical protein